MMTLSFSYVYTGTRESLGILYRRERTRVTRYKGTYLVVLHSGIRHVNMLRRETATMPPLAIELFISSYHTSRNIAGVWEYCVL